MDGPPNLRAIFATAYDIACGLQHLHSKDIVHGDLSAFNIMLTSTETEKSPGAVAHAGRVGGRGFVAKVADFGKRRGMKVAKMGPLKTCGSLMCSERCFARLWPA